MITENLSTLKIHKLTQAQYDRELEAGRIDPSALYLTPEETGNSTGGNIDLTGYATEQWVQEGFQPKGNYALKTEIPSVPVQSVNGKTGAVQLSASDVGADPNGTAVTAVSQHNMAGGSHNDIRLELKAINDRLTAFFDSDNQTLDELSEIVAYITSNKTLIDSITTSKVNVTDIINNLATNVSNKPLSAAQGVVLKGLIDTVSNSLSGYQPKGDYALRSELPTVPTKVSAFTNDAGYLTQHQDISGKLDASELPTAINTALAQAKASGEFDGRDGEDAYTPVRGVDYWTAEDIAAIDADIATELAKRGQLQPEYAQTIEECTDTTKLYVLPDGYLYAYVGKKVEGGTTPNFTNQLAIAEDMASTAPFNGIGYMTGVYLSTTSTGYNAGAANEWTTGYIPYTPDETIYIKGVGFTSASHDRIYLFAAKNADVKTAIASGNNVATYFTVETLGDNYYKLTPKSGAGFAAGIQYARMGFTTGTPSEVIITVNEPITYTTVEGGTVYEWANTGHAFVPADYEDRIVALEQENEQLKSNLADAEQRIDTLEGAGTTGTDVPDGVKDAVSVLVDKSLSRNGNKLLRFLVSADAHQDNTNALITKGNRELGQAHGEILKLMGVDFVANLGDITWGATGSSNQAVLEEAKSFNRFMLDNIRGQTQIWTEGNHETALLTESQIHGLIYSHNKGLAQNAEQWIDGYGYMDFPNQKVRVICLNTDQATGNDSSGVSDAQLKWFAETALNMEGKTDWSVITMGHHPLDYNNITMYKNCMWVLEAFLNGSNLDFTTNTGTRIAVDYGDRSGQYVGHFHGHAHAFSVVKMQKWVGVDAYEEVDAWEICIPNACYERNNQYLNNGQYIQRYSTATTYSKADEDGKRTSFNLVTVCLDGKTIYADNYGAGIDREISY